MNSTPLHSTALCRILKSDFSYKVCLTFFFVVFLFSCRKEQAIVSVPQEIVAERFFNEHRTNSTEEKHLVDFLNRLNEKKGFINKTVERIGFPHWDKLVKYSFLSNSSCNVASLSTGSSSKQDSATNYIIPFVRDTQNYVNATMFIKTTSTDTTITYLCDWQYSQFNNNNLRSSQNPEAIALFFMRFDNNVFNSDCFKILDTSLFSSQNKVANKLSINSNSSQLLNPKSLSQSQICFEVTIELEEWTPGNLLGVFNGNCMPCISYVTQTFCQTELFESGWGSSFSGGGGVGGGGGGGAAPPSNDDGSRPGWRKFNTPVFDPNNPWDGIDNPYNAKDDPINFDVAGIEVGKKYDSDNPPQIIRRVGYSKRTPPNIDDMESGTNGDISGIWVAPYFYVFGPKLITDPTLSDNELFESMDILFNATTYYSRDLRKVSIEMRQKFRDGSQGGPYKNDILNNKVSESTEMMDYIESFRKLFSVELKKANGNILSTDQIDMKKLRPKFSSTHHLFHGLQILINDTESTNIMVYDYIIDSNGNWEAEVVFEITDHFGLDKNDVLTYQAYHRGFVAWWALQHKRDYKPFLTNIYVTRKLKGKI